MVLEDKNKLCELGYEVTKHINAILSYWDRDFICRFANNAYEEWYGLSPKQMIGKMNIKELPGPHCDNNFDYLNSLLEGKMQVFEHDFLLTSGEIRNSIATCTPDWENGKVKGFYLHVADITEVKKKFTRESVDTGKIQGDNYSASEKVLNAIEQTLQSGILKKFPGLKKIARQHFISESKLKRDFKQKFSTSVFSYYRNLQMQLAEKYIHEKRFTKKEISEMFHFSNPSNFSACYKKHLSQKKL